MKIGRFPFPVLKLAKHNCEWSEFSMLGFSPFVVVVLKHGDEFPRLDKCWHGDFTASTATSCHIMCFNSVESSEKPSLVSV